MPRNRLGEILLQHGWITRADLARGLRAQQLVGGRLGTALLESEALSEEQLLTALTEQHGVDAAAVEDLRVLDAETLALLPRKLAIRCRAVPLRARGGRLDLAMDDPANLAGQDEMSFATSRRLRVLVTSEVRLLEALSRYYDEPLPGRFVGLLDRLNRQRSLLQKTAGDAAVAELSPGPERRRPAVGRRSPAPAPAAAAEVRAGAGGETAAVVAPPPRTPRIVGPSAVSLSPGERAELYGGPASRRAAGRTGKAPPPAPDERDLVSAGETDALLDAAADPEEVGRILLAFLRPTFDRVLLFQVRRDRVHGWLAAGDGLDAGRFSRLEITFDRPSIFLNLRQGSAFHLGPLAAMPAHRPLAALLGGEHPRECLLLPVRLGQRMVVVLYADRGGDRLAGVDLEALRRLAQQAANAFERCISLKRKAHSRPAAG